MKTSRNNIKKLMIALALLLGVACTGLGSDWLVQVLGGTDLQSTEIGNGLTNPENIFDEAKVSLNGFKFSQFERCSLEEEGEELVLVEDFEYSEHLVFDLLKKTVTPEVDSIQFPQKIKICKFSFKLDQLSAAEAPEGIDSDDELIGSSALIKGEHNGTPFVVRIDLDQNIELNSSAGMNFTSGEEVDVFLIFELSKLFLGVDLDTLALTSGTIYIDSNDNTSAYTQVRSNLISNIKLVRDENSNGKFDSNDVAIAQ